MPKYAVKIGEIHMVSEEPITAEQKSALMDELRRHPFNVYEMLVDNVAVLVVPDKV